MNYINIQINNYNEDNENNKSTTEIQNHNLEQNLINNSSNLSNSTNIYNSNNLDNINEFENYVQIIVPRKNYYCSNCNKKGHTFKNCNESIISNGIIAIYIKNFSIKQNVLLENYITNNLKIFDNSSTNLNSKTKLQNDIVVSNYTNNDIIGEINKNIKFLMVQRKHSLGYLEFIRGRYNLDNTKTIIHLIEQMTPNEINQINTKDFDFLWNNLWDSNNVKNKNHHKEYLISKQKFYQIKLNFNEIITNTKPKYNFNEWGFPKGRRETYESDLVCAVREFEEETSLKEHEYIILEKCKSVRENLIGTNGISYAHNYYLSLINKNYDSIDESNREIGHTKVFNISECLEKIRPYHKNKIKIVKHIYMIVNNFLQEYYKI